MSDHERQLLRSACKGEAAAFEELTAPHQTIVYNFILSECGNEFEACQLTQDVFVKVFELLTTNTIAGSLLPYIYKTAGDLCRRRVRESRKIS
jgi:RNA polymerase sigma-70 factor (ECF subfamily)